MSLKEKERRNLEKDRHGNGQQEDDCCCEAESKDFRHDEDHGAHCCCDYDHDHDHHEHHHDHGGCCCCDHGPIRFDDDGCGCGHDHGESVSKGEFIRVVASFALFMGIMIGEHMGFSLGGFDLAWLCLIPYLIVGYEVLWTSVKNISKGQVFDENFLMSVATIGALAIGKFDEAVAVMLFYQIGELFQDYAVGRSRNSIAALMNIRPDYANLLQDGALTKVSPKDVEKGQLILVKAGEKIPLDGVVVEGSASLNTSALTGESAPGGVGPGSEVMSGCINEDGLLTIQVTKEYGESTVAKILELVEHSQEKKAKTENFITKFARYYTPVVVFLAIGIAVIPPLVLSGAAFSDWLYRGLLFLVISCPCALVISIPLGFFGGIGGASRCGVLMKGGNYLEVLANTEIMVFDKTGTLTKGTFQVEEIHPEKGIKESELLEACAYGECYSNHPIARSIVAAYGEDAVDRGKIRENEEIAGHGMRILLDGVEILAGNQRLMEKFGISGVTERPAAGTTIHVAKGGAYLGSIVVGDELKPDAKDAMIALKREGIKETVMLTGDTEHSAKQVAEKVGLDQYYAQLLPGDKVQRVESLLASKSSEGRLAYVGDGINDAPVLARADVGIAMGGLGSDAAIEAADVVLMTDELMKLVQAKKIAKKTMRIIRENIVFAIGVKVIVLILGAIGAATMWAAVFADVGVAVLSILNASRTLGVKKL